MWLVVNWCSGLRSVIGELPTSSDVTGKAVIEEVPFLWRRERCTQTETEGTGLGWYSIT